MTDVPPLPPLDYANAQPQPQPEPQRGVRATSVIAWTVVLLVCCSLTGLSILRGTSPKAKRLDPVSAEEVDAQTKLAGKYAVAVNHFSQTQGAGSLAAMPDKPTTSPEARVAAAIVAGEIDGREAALKRLKQIDSPDAQTLSRYYQTASTQPATQATEPVPAAPTTRPDLSSLEDRYGWFIRLAEAFGKPDSDPARTATMAEATRTLVVIVSAFATLGVLGLVGFVLMIVAIVFAATGKIRLAVGRPAGPSHVYIEAFAIYLGGFVLTSLSTSWLAPGAPLWVHLAAFSVAIVLAACWPKLRGVPWGVARRDLGVHTGRGVILEMLAGLGGYLAGIPIMVVGIIITVGLIALTHVDATHPISQDTGDSALMLYFLASVFAPITEEFMFRGLLVSHLRGTVGAFLAALASAVIFASVHPQGWAAIPALTSVAIVFAMVRQWRGSLIPSMLAHATHNAMLVTVLVLATR